ncbi:MAG: hypothetical protein ACKVIF_00270 [Rhodospirillales bacterium]
MSRDLASNTAIKYASTNVFPITFVKLEFLPTTASPTAGIGTIRLHNGLGTYTWDDGSGSQSWTGTGNLGQISKIQEGEEVSPYGIQLTLSGLDPDLVGEAIKETYYQRPVTLYVGALNDSDQLVATPDVMWTGFMDLMSASVGADGGDSLVLNCESELAMFERSRNLLFTNSSQQVISSGDTFFNQLQDMEDLTLAWGKKGNRIAGRGPGFDGAPFDDIDLENLDLNAN